MELSIERLTKRFGSKVAVNNISVTLQPGVYGLLGANGAGKTTLMRMVCNVLKPTAGKILYDGKEVEQLGETYRSYLGYLPQDFGYYLDFTAKEYLDFIAAVKGIETATAKKKVWELLETVNLSDVAGKKIRTFSGGMKQRLGIAMALINSPELLILDEPVNGLDPMGMVDVRELLRSLCEEDGITILISSHILAELYQLVTDYIIISHGQILETITKEALDEKCSAYILLEVPETKAALKVLAEHGIKSVSNENERIKIYDNVSIKDVARWMFDANVLVTLLMQYEKSLENYYMELLGGEA